MNCSWVNTPFLRVAPVLVLCGLAACSAPAPLDNNDPHESANRRIHEANVVLDGGLVAPVARAAAPILKSPIGTGISNVADNLSMPSAILNKAMQGKPEDMVHNSWRFVINSTLGLAGLFDPATAMGLDKRDTDFGATLHTWGAAEGPFMMLPVLGPSTERDFAGILVDVVLDPVGNVLQRPESYWARGIKVTSKLGDRVRFGDTVDSILYGSADSYSQMRLMYLQSRRFELGQEATDDAFIDPYEDPVGN